MILKTIVSTLAQHGERILRLFTYRKTKVIYERTLRIRSARVTTIRCRLRTYDTPAFGTRDEFLTRKDTRNAISTSAPNGLVARDVPGNNRSSALYDYRENGRNPGEIYFHENCRPSLKFVPRLRENGRNAREIYIYIYGIDFPVALRIFITTTVEWA